jgi:23S rRNA (adenine2503-C2)-methyltransferase
VCPKPSMPRRGAKFGSGNAPDRKKASRPAVRPARAPALGPDALLALYRPDLCATLRQDLSPSYRFEQVFEHLLRRPDLALTEATVLPVELRAKLEQQGSSTLTETEARSAPDGTTKLLFSTRDGRPLETVLMRYRDRLTVCASSQIGCSVGCFFCATGQMGLQRGLAAGEIVDQVRACSALGAREERRLTNMVFMGMGEPLLNLQAVLASISILTDPRGLGLAHRAISVSTIGIPAGMVTLARREPQVNLALSLHAPDDRTRALLVPDRFRHPLREILAAAWEHFAITHRKLLVEYVLVKGINDSLDQARALAKLLKGHVVAVNLMTWNPVPRLEGRAPFQPSDPASVQAFREALASAHVEVVLRHSKGGGINGACGQLAGKRQPYDLGGSTALPPRLGPRSGS